MLVNLDFSLYEERWTPYPRFIWLCKVFTELHTQIFLLMLNCTWTWNFQLLLRDAITNVCYYLWCRRQKSVNVSVISHGSPFTSLLGPGNAELSHKNWCVFSCSAAFFFVTSPFPYAFCSRSLDPNLGSCFILNKSRYTMFFIPIVPLK